jgi:ElaB/YqjD/DUF883 family membrane-anchored ribosome-binding protein
MSEENTDHSLQEVIVIEDEALAQGFTQIPNTVLRRKDLSAGAKLTYMVLLSYAWEKGSCFPGQERLAEDIGAGKRSVIRYVQELQETGLLEIKRRGLGKTNVYILKRLHKPRSAKLAFQEVPKTTHQEVPNLHLEEYSVEEYSEQQQQPSQNNHPSDVVVLASLLKERGVHPKTAMALVKNHSPDHIRSKIELFDWLQQHHSSLVSKNPAGWLRKAIEENWQPPPQYTRAKEGEQRRRQQQEAQVREEAQRVQEQAEYYLSTSPEEAGERWVAIHEQAHKSLGRPPLTKEQREAAYQQAVARFLRSRGEFFAAHPELAPAEARQEPSLAYAPTTRKRGGDGVQPALQNPSETA